MGQAIYRPRRSPRMDVTGAIDVVSVGNTTTVVLAADPKREIVFLTNAADERIDVALGTAAIANKGIGLLHTSPQSMLMLDAQHGAMMSINAICASGTKNLSVQTITGP